jgi:hypothetical protein
MTGDSQRKTENANPGKLKTDALLSPYATGVNDRAAGFECPAVGQLEAHYLK